MRRLFQTALIGILWLITSLPVAAQGTATEIRRGVLPPTCDPAKGQIFFETSTNTIYQCSATDTWERVGSRLTTLAVTGTADAGTLTEGTNAVPNATDHLGFFASTTSAQLDTVISDDTGSGALMFATSPTVTTSILANTTGVDIGSAATRFDAFLDVVSIGNLNDIRIVDDNKFTTIDLAEADCATSACVVVVRASEGTGSVTRSTWDEAAAILDLRGDESDPFVSGAYYSPFKFINRKTTDSVGTLEIFPTIRALQFHDSGGDNVGAGIKDTYFTFAGDLYSSGRGQDHSIRGAVFKFGSGDSVAIAGSTDMYGNCLEGGGECAVGYRSQVRMGQAASTATVDSYVGGTRTITYSSGVQVDKLGVDRVIINTTAAKIYSTGTISSIGTAAPPVVTGSGTAWSTEFGAGAHTDICFSQADDDASGFKFVVPIRSIASDTSLTLDFDPQGADQAWPGDNNGSTVYRIYKCALIESHSFAGASDTTGTIVHAAGGTTDWVATDTLEAPLGWAWYGGGINVIVQNPLPAFSAFGIAITNSGSDEALTRVISMSSGKAALGLVFDNTWECQANNVNCSTPGFTTGIRFQNPPTVGWHYATTTAGANEWLRLVDSSGTTGNVRYFHSTTSDCTNIEHSAATSAVIQFCPLNGSIVGDILSIRSTGSVRIGTDPADAGSIRLPNAGSIQFEASPAGTDVNALNVDSGENVNIGSSGATAVIIGTGLSHRATQTLAASTTPSVAGANVFATNSTASITDFTGGTNGQVIYLLCGADTTTSLTDSTPLFLAGAFTCTADDSITLVFNGSVWTEISRSAN